MNTKQNEPRLHDTVEFEHITREDLDTTIVDRFEKMVEWYPNHPAIKQDGTTYTYSQINKQANQVANVILMELGEYRGPVAFLVDHGLPQVIAILGILKSGNAYIVLDPEFPRDRLAFMLSDSEAPLILTNSESLSSAEALSDQKRIILDIDEISPDTPTENLGLEIPVDATALIQYTSGSTGEPKGVILPHQFIMHMAFSRDRNRRIYPEDRCIFLVSGSFAAHLGPVMNTLLNGACLFPYDLKVGGLGKLADFLVNEQINVIQMVASTFRTFASLLNEDTNFADVRSLNLSADTCLKIDVELYKKFFPSSCVMVNSLGGTEFMSGGYYEITKDTLIEGGIVPVGYAPIDKTVYIHNEDGEEVPSGEVGEIVIESRYLSPGYWKMPDLTKKKFVPVPGEDGLRRYYTGDLGRKGPDDCLYHLGRIDDQVKIRGNRVELGEITSRLFDIPPIKDAYTHAHHDQNGESILISYVVPGNQTENLVDQIYSNLGATLPSYMVPAEILVLENIPKLPSGKVDRQALPIPVKTRATLKNEFVAPRNPSERKLVEILEKLLEFKPVGVLDDFFDLGGHSLMAMRLIAEIENQFGKTIPFPALVQTRTVEGIAQLLTEEDALDPWSYLVALQPLGSKPPLFCVPPSAVTVMVFKDLAKYIDQDRPTYGLEYLGMEGENKAHNNLVEMTKFNLTRIRALQPEGPYFLAGMCFGGLVAFEMAQQLLAAEEEVAFLGIMDSTQAPNLSRPKSYPVFMLTRFINQKILRQRFPIGMAPLKRMMKAFSPEDELGKRLYEVFATHNYARVTYTTKPYPRRITLFNTAGSRGDFSRDQWRRVSRVPLEVISIPGVHKGHRVESKEGDQSFIKEPMVQVLAREMNRCMDEAAETVAR